MGTKTGAGASGFFKQGTRAARLLTPPIVFEAFKRAFTPKFPFEYRFNDVSIMLPKEHLLPEFQRSFPNYDRFLPHLAGLMPPSATIIDIGANVGDTLAGMVEKNSASTYVCIEPDDAFFGFLTQNIESIRRVKQSLVVHAVKSLVGNHVSAVSLEGKGGTKRAVVSETGLIKSRTLDAILLDLPEIPDVRLLKSDVDGFDYDVLEASKDVIERYKPLIFFECQYFFEYQKDGFCKLLEKLQVMAYHDWVVFDNFGEVIIRTKDIGAIVQLIEYIWRQNTEKSPRTINYFDILAIPTQEIGLVDTALATYV